MFGNIAPTPYDLRFELFRIPVRVHPLFWVTAALITWVQGRLDLTIVRIFCVFFAVLVHELGHALVTRRFGWQPEIMLHMLGGLATTRRHSTWKDIAVSAAGPAAGFLLALIIWLVCALLGLWAPETTILNPTFDGAAMQDWPPAIAINSAWNRRILTAIRFSLLFNLFINAMNLIPVLPLDGGQISREYWLWAKPRDGMQICLQTSVATGGGIAAWVAFSLFKPDAPWSVRGVLGRDGLFLGLMFGYLAYLSYEELQRIGGRRW